jgi:hypothetical protein
MVGKAMTVDPPSACYGLACPQRGRCALHEALGLVDGNVIESCQRGQTWPLFRHVEGETM